MRSHDYMITYSCALSMIRNKMHSDCSDRLCDITLTIAVKVLVYVE